jgi:excisionase family DNA binding protein
MSQGKGVSVIPVMQELTTQQAANLLGVSRPFLVDLLGKNQIPFHKTGTHRRIYLKDVLDYQERRDSDRKRILDEMARRAVEEGDYDQMRVPEE